MLVEALVAKLAVEAFHEAILLRLAWRDVVPFDAVLLGPFDDRVASELGAVVGHDHRRLAVLGDEAVERAHDALARQRGVDFGSESLAGHLVLHGEHPEATACLQYVRHEVEHPDVVRPHCGPQRRPGAQRPLAAAPPAHCQAFLAVEPVDFLQVHAPPFALGHLTQPPITEPATLGRQHAQQRAIRGVVRAPMPVAQPRPVDTEKPRGTSFR